MSEGTRNPQINISKIPGGAGIAGALFALGSMLIFLIGIPRLRFFFIAAIVLGCAIALILRFVRRETPGKPGILSATPNTDSPIRPAQTGRSSKRPEEYRHKLHLGSVVSIAPSS